MAVETHLWLQTVHLLGPSALATQWLLGCISISPELHLNGFGTASQCLWNCRCLLNAWLHWILGCTISNWATLTTQMRNPCHTVQDLSISKTASHSWLAKTVLQCRNMNLLSPGMSEVRVCVKGWRFWIIVGVMGLIGAIGYAPVMLVTVSANWWTLSVGL